MDEPIDTMGPWTIKAVPTEIRNKVTAAARKEGLTVGQWLERRVNEWLEDGGALCTSPAIYRCRSPGTGQHFHRRRRPT